ncbi:MAG: hypothetical protein M3P51_09095 [Chloroflexota bacterium]|nr:hypothetical protein [Chloroflexota bacterium]
MSPLLVCRIHLVLTIVWILLLIPTLLWWRDSVTWIVAMSLWANIASHFAGWSAGRTEVRQERQEEQNGL